MCIAQAIKHLLKARDWNFYHILITQKLFSSVVGVSLKPP